MSKTSTPQRSAGGGGSAILNAWRAQRESERALRSPAGLWSPGMPQAQMLKAPPTAGLRRFMAASNDRLVADMMDSLGLVSGNAEVRMGLRSMRARSRKLAKDNEYVRNVLALLRNNVPGPRGFNVQSKIYKRGGKLDIDANKTIEQAHAEFSRQGIYTACGRMSRAAFERAGITCMARDGEWIVEILYGRQFSRFGIAFAIVDPDLLDDQLNVGQGGSLPGYGSLDDGNSVRMGVEVDRYNRAVAYWFHNYHPGDDVGSRGVYRHRRVEASRIRHWYLVDDARPGVTRGVPLIYSGIRRMAMLGGYEEAALVNARQGASKMGFYKQPVSDTGPVDGSKVSDNGEDADPADDLYQEAEPGVFGVLPPGWDFTTYDPAYPNDAMGGFIKNMLRAFTSGVGISYNVVTGDYENVNLSSMRYAGLQDRDTFEALQGAMVDGMLQSLFEVWLEFSLSMGQIGRLPPDAFVRLNQPRFVGRPWRSPDPQKDVAAGAQKVALGTTSRTRLCAEEGADFEEVLDELAQEEEMAKARGVTLNTAAAQASKNPPKTKPGPAESATEPDSDDEGAPAAEGADDESASSA